MGTNYYLMTGKKHREVCSLGHVHLVPETYHIGKSSMGRYFTLHALVLEDGTVLKSLKAWKDFAARFKKGWIQDEYGEKIDPEEMWKKVTREDYAEIPGWKQTLGKPCPNQGGYRSTSYYDEFGVKGLVKSHGLPVGEDGLYVIMSGDFS